MASTRGKYRKKPSKPYPTFPLTAHNNGQWCKKIRGKIHFFGTWDQPEAALQRYLAVAHDLHRGRQPMQSNIRGDPPRVKDVCNYYLTYMYRRAEAGEITPQWCEDCRRTVTDFAGFVGADLPAGELRPLDFGRYRQKLQNRGLRNGRGPLGLHAIDRSVTVVKAAFTYAYEMELLDRPVRFGRSFRRSSLVEKRRSHASAVREHGLRCFRPEDVRALVNESKGPLRAMILLGINGGFGNTDCAMLPLNAIDQQKPLINYPRPKSGITRAVPLWPETLDALQQDLRQRPQPSCEEARNLVFLTRYGNPWVHRKSQSGESRTDSVGQEFGKLLRKLRLRRNGLV